MAVSREEIKDALGKMPVLELVDLIKELEDEWGVSAAAPVSVAAAPAATTVSSAPSPASRGSGSPLTAPLPGSIFSLKCNVGDGVNEGDTVLVMESMKMESEVKAHQSGTIQSILVKEGDNVQTGDQLVIIG